MLKVVKKKSPASSLHTELGETAAASTKLLEGRRLATDFNAALKALNADNSEKLLLPTAIRKQAAADMPKTAGQLHDYLRAVHGMDIPWRPVVEGFDAPFEAYVAAYFRLYDRILQMGPRNSGKTNNLATMAHTTAMAYPGSSWVHASAQKSQAEVVGKYIGQYKEDPVFKSGFTHETFVRQVRYKNSSRWYLVTGSPSGINSHHPELLSLDEIEWWSVAALDQAYAVPTERRGMLDALIAVSTRQRAAGAMAYLWENSEEYGFKQFAWTIFECMEQCRTCIAEDQEPYGTDAARNKVCPLWEDCRGVYGKKCTGFIPRSKVVSYKQLREDLWDTQFMCRKPSTSGLVLPTFDKTMALFDGGSGVWLGGGNLWPWNFNPNWPWEIWHDPSEGGTAVFWFVQRDPRYGYLYVFDCLPIYNCQHDNEAKEKLVEYWRTTGLPDPEFILIDPHKPETKRFYGSGSLVPMTGVQKRFNAICPKMGSVRGADAKRNTEIVGSLSILRNYVMDAQKRRWIFFHPLKCRVGIDRGVMQYSYPMDQKTFEVKVGANPVKDGADDFVDPLRYGVIHDSTARQGGPARGHQLEDATQYLQLIDREFAAKGSIAQ